MCRHFCYTTWQLGECCGSNTYHLLTATSDAKGPPTMTTLISTPTIDWLKSERKEIMILSLHCALAVINLYCPLTDSNSHAHYTSPRTHSQKSKVTWETISLDSNRSYNPLVIVLRPISLPIPHSVPLHRQAMLTPSMLSLHHPSNVWCTGRLLPYWVVPNRLECSDRVG